MKKIGTLTGATICATVLFSGAGGAQETAPLPTPIVEIFACNYRGESDMADLRSVIDRWDTWADRNNTTDYGALLATPQFRGADRTWDVLWFGRWPNGAAMGAGLARWLTSGEEMAAAFDTVLDCPSHAQYAQVVVRRPAGPPPESMIQVFRDCSLREGRTMAEATSALGQWADYLVERGSDPFAAMLIPLAGLVDDADFAFKAVEGFSSMEGYGEYTDLYTGGGFMRAEALFGRLLDCNSPRVYVMERLRLAAQEQLTSAAE